MTHFYRDLAYVFAAALAGGWVAHRLRQPLILGYVLAGIAIGPFTPGPSLAEIPTLERLAEIGVILLMYSIGIEFSLRDLLRVKWVAILGGPIGIFLSIALSLAAGRLMGWSPEQGIVIGAVVSVASTMVLSRLLLDYGQLRTEHGRLMMGITLIEDFAVVVMVILLPLLHSVHSGQVLSGLASIGKGFLLLIPCLFVASKLIPAILSAVVRLGNEELSLLVALAMGFGAAVVTQALGFSLALGAFLAGLFISGSRFSVQTFGRLLPLRDAFVALFFVTVGALIDPRALRDSPMLLLVIIGLIVAGKLAIWTLVVRLFGYPPRTAALVALGLTQIGEFSYLLVHVARQSGLIGREVYNAVLAASLLTIVLNTLLAQFIFRRIPVDDR